MKKIFDPNLLPSIQYYSKKIFQTCCPFTCIQCQSNSDQSRDLCRACENQLPWQTYHCARCALPLPNASSNTAHIKIFCGECLNSPPLFHQTIALFDYQQPIANWISQLKFQKKLHIARLFGELLTERLQQYYHTHSLPDAILPVPLHSLRLLSRGFNQSVELIRHAQDYFDLPMIRREVIRQHNTRSQIGMSADDRKQNLQLAFQIKQTLPYQKIAIVDDVITTGATIGELCRLLKKNGIAEIDVWCIARTGL